ncbi:hypothetical protein C5U62_31925 [Pseudomonas protegens]|uniref:Uncharacterized protein n=1 Tax=Pseudomonas protegens TaxID=380021 RepID=A0A2T6GBB3_9PSED|nr:hypothetical protein [Pseudomonas protegens]PUA41445.1 hypothetical protein C5U62_31925 [Pseudomonas protegens]
MARQEINLGALPNGVGGDTPRVANTKINDMTAELYAAIAESGGAVKTVAGVDPDAAGDIPKVALATAVGVDEKADKTALENKVDKVAGKGLSSNDFTTTEKTKLSTLVNPASYGVGGPAPLVDNIYQVKDGGITYWNQATTGRPPTGGQGNLISMTGGLNGSASTFIATSLDEDKVFFSRVNGATRAPWKQFLLAGDQGIGGPAIPVPGGDCNKAVTAGAYRTVPETVNGRNVYGLLEVFDYGDNGNSKIQRLTATYGHPIGDATWFRSGTDQGTRWSTWQRLVAAGNFGIGVDPRTGSPSELVKAINDANVLEPNGTYLVHAETANSPRVYGTFRMEWYDANGWTQTITEIATGYIWTRGCINGAVQPWLRQYTETITNANGTAIKFPDGTMICYAQGGAEKTTSNPNGYIWAGNEDIFTYPVPFKTLAGVIPTVAYSLNAYVWCCVGGGQDLVKCTINGFSGGSNGKYVIRYMAIGRWK